MTRWIDWVGLGASALAVVCFAFVLVAQIVELIAR